MKTVHYFDGKTYEWVGLSLQPSILGKVCKCSAILVPNSICGIFLTTFYAQVSIKCFTCISDQSELVKSIWSKS